MIIVEQAIYRLPGCSYHISAMSGVLSAARYGKTLVRVLRVVREGSWHNIVEYNVEALLEGDIATRYISLRLEQSVVYSDSDPIQLYPSRQLCRSRDRFK
jgi:hypothetical protein